MIYLQLGEGALVVVCIPALNEARYIEQTLKGLIEGDPNSETYDYIVIDGGSRDGTQDIVEKLKQRYNNLKLVHNPGRTQAAALNMAISNEFGQNDVLVRCDAHARYPIGYVTRLVESLKDSRAASVVVPMDAISGSRCFERALSWVADSLLGAGGAAHRGGNRSHFVDHGHHAAFAYDVFQELGGYDTSFVTNEDAEFDRRLVSAGHRIYLDADIRLGYYVRPTIGSLWTQYFRYGYGRAQNCLKHRNCPKVRQLVPNINIVLLAVSLMLMPFSWVGLVWPALYLGLLAGISVVMTVSKQSLCGILCGPALGTMHIAWGLGFFSALGAHFLNR